MDDTTPLSICIQNWRQQQPAKGANETALRHLDKINHVGLLNELNTYLTALYVDEGEHRIQLKKIEGPEDYPHLLHSVEMLKRYKARIRAIGLEAKYYLRVADELYDTIKRWLQLQPEFQELRTLDTQKTVAGLVTRELLELKAKCEGVADMAKDVSAEYSDRFNADLLEYNIVNAMSYHRGLYGSNGNPAHIAPKRQF